MVAVAPLSTVSDCGPLAEPACPEPAAPVNAAVSDSGELLAANDVVHVVVPVDPLGVTGWLVQPYIGVPLAENATVPDGATLPLVFVITVAVRVTFWLVAVGDGFGVASVVVVGVEPLTTVAVTLLAV